MPQAIHTAQQEQELKHKLEWFSFLALASIAHAMFDPFHLLKIPFTYLCMSLCSGSGVLPSEREENRSPGARGFGIILHWAQGPLLARWAVVHKHPDRWTFTGAVWAMCLVLMWIDIPAARYFGMPQSVVRIKAVCNWALVLVWHSRAESDPRRPLTLLDSYCLLQSFDVFMLVGFWSYITGVSPDNWRSKAGWAIGRVEVIAVIWLLIAYAYESRAADLQPLRAAVDGPPHIAENVEIVHEGEEPVAQAEEVTRPRSSKGPSARLISVPRKVKTAARDIFHDEALPAMGNVFAIARENRRRQQRAEI